MSIVPWLLMTGVALNPAANPDYIETAWVIQPDPTQIGEREVRDGEFVLKHRLLPPSLVELTEDAKDAKSGNVIAKAGDQLFGLLTSGAPVYCISPDPEKSLMRSLMSLQRCMIDVDHDGRLDSAFDVRNSVPGVPNFMRTRPKKLKPVTGGTYTKVAPEQDRQNYFVGIRYEGRTVSFGKGTQPTFSIKFGAEGNLGTLTAQRSAETSVTPFDMSILGSSFTVQARDGEVIRVKVSQPMPAQRFDVVQTAQYY